MALQNLNRVNSVYITRGRYSRHPKDTPNQCVYCGQMADSIDHFVPICVMERLVQIDIYLHSPILTSCRECNIIAGGRYFTTFKAKRAYIRRKLVKHNSHLLRVPEWTEEELLEMGPTMQMEIRQAMQMGAVIRFRIQYESTIVIVLPNLKKLFNM